MPRECWERFPRHRLQRKPLVSDLGMHHGTGVTHVPWCMSRSLTRGGGETVNGIPDACATRNFTYLARGPWLNKAWCLECRELNKHKSKWVLRAMSRGSKLQGIDYAWSWAILYTITATNKGSILIYICIYIYIHIYIYNKGRSTKKRQVIRLKWQTKNASTFMCWVLYSYALNRNIYFRFLLRPCYPYQILRDTGRHHHTLLVRLNTSPGNLLVPWGNKSLLEAVFKSKCIILCAREATN